MVLIKFKMFVNLVTFLKYILANWFPNLSSGCCRENKTCSNDGGRDNTFVVSKTVHLDMLRQGGSNV